MNLKKVTLFGKKMKKGGLALENHIFFFLFFLFKDFIYLFTRDREREAETQAEGEAGSMQGA